MSNSPFASIEQAIAATRAGKMVILVDDENRENEGDLCIAAEAVTPEAINFMAVHARGLICLPMSQAMADDLDLPMMVAKNESKYGTAFTVSIEAAQGVSTGISAADRARTIQAAVAVNAKPSDVIRPGHVFPLRACDGGVLVRSGQTEGSVDLARLAGLRPAAVICEIINDDGTMARLDDLIAFSQQHNLLIVKVNDLIAYRIQHEVLVDEMATARLPVENHGPFTLRVFKNQIDGQEHLVLQAGELDVSKPVLVRLHSECLTGDIFGSTRCDCGEQLQTSMQKISEQGGVVVYVRGHEGRGIGLANKIKAYQLQDEQGLDTVEANHQLGFEADERDYGVAAQMLRHLGVKAVRLLTNNPVKVESLAAYGIAVAAREALVTLPTEENTFYLQTKRTKLGHIFENLDELQVS